MRAIVALAAALAFAPTALAGVRVAVEPHSAGLGDPLRYVVEVRAPSVDKVAVTADAGPFLVVAGPTVTRTHSLVRVEQTLLCVDRGCAPGAHPTRVALPPPRVTNGGVSTSTPAAAVTLVPRVPASVVAASRAHYRRQVAIPPASTRIAPGLFAALLLGAAVVLVAAALLIALRGLRRARPRLAPAVAGGLERALALLRQSAARPAPDRRRAADYAARAASARAELAADAERVAWSPPDPEPDDVGALADRIEAALGR